jgi:hypothetical protein
MVVFRAEELSYLAHRAAWQCYRGPIPEGMQVNHHCDRPLCCNPDCLFLGSQADNIADMMSKGRHCSGRNVGEENGRAEITKAEALDVLAMWEEGFSQRTIAEEKGISPSQVGRIIRRESWKHLTEKV